MSIPVISIVMPVYNAGNYLIDSVASILSQSHRDWELICINDGSLDATPEILNWFALQDSRIRVIHQSNRGIVDALNCGLQHARAPLVARMDHDDIAFADRLAIQLEFMSNSPGTVACGGAILEMDEQAAPLGVQHPQTTHEEICANLLRRRTGLFHPTAMIRSEALRAVGGYRKEYQWVEDHDLWLRLALRGQLANVERVVLCYRQHASSICWQRSQIQRTRMNDLLIDAYQHRGLTVPDNLIVTNTTVRSPAGPGKWARAAARGGYPLVALKHLRRMWQDKGRQFYSIRMTAEVGASSMLGLARRLLTERSLKIPEFTQWHRRIANDLDSVARNPASAQTSAA